MSEALAAVPNAAPFANNQTGGVVRPDGTIGLGGAGHREISNTRMENRLVANVVPIGASYLREQAHRVVRLARDCPHRPTSHELEAIGMELMEKALEIDELLSDKQT